MTPERPICVLIGALGGQGGGVLTDWLVEAAQLAGYPAQATSIPGVAQRTGATTYYFELFPRQTAPAEPVFSLYPGAGDVDLVVALEPTEAGRALERGYITHQTTVVSNVARIYSTAEKIVAGNGIVPVAHIFESLGRATNCLIAIDPSESPGSHVNALIFGAMLGSGVLPLTAADGHAAIKSKGLAVATSLAGFDAGWSAAAAGGRARADSQEENATPQGAGQSGLVPPGYELPPAGFEQTLAVYPHKLQPLLGHALARLVDYQDEAYASRYLARLERVLAADRQTEGHAHAFKLSGEVARRLAAWMAYEDVIRVAQLKTRPGRLARIRREIGAGAAEPLTVTDFLSPSRNELLNLLPPSLARLLPGGNGETGFALSLSWPTSSPLGYGLLKLLAALKRLRPRSQSFATEQAAIDTWLDAVVITAGFDYELACQVAELAAWARGYGQVRADGLACLQELFTGWAARLEADRAAVRSSVVSLLFKLRHDPDTFCRPSAQSSSQS
jgi:indolepyruvate ferredoxin oxidoreductase, beta subunit